MKARHPLTNWRPSWFVDRLIHECVMATGASEAECIKLNGIQLRHIASVFAVGSFFLRQHCVTSVKPFLHSLTLLPQVHFQMTVISEPTNISYLVKLTACACLSYEQGRRTAHPVSSSASQPRADVTPASSGGRCRMSACQSFTLQTL